MRYTSEIKINFHHADPAGIMYFANIFTFAHVIFEEFIQAAGFTWADWFQKPKLIVPIRHTQCNYLSPLYAGQTYEVSVRVSALKETSFTVEYVFSKDSKCHANVTMTHVYVDPNDGKKATIPTADRERLKQFAS